MTPRSSVDVVVDEPGMPAILIEKSDSPVLRIQKPPPADRFARPPLTDRPPKHPGRPVANPNADLLAARTNVMQSQPGVRKSLLRHPLARRSNAGEERKESSGNEQDFADPNFNLVDSYDYREPETQRYQY
jgi:hypothetical protein